jgi:hypothetical protein
MRRTTAKDHEVEDWSVGMVELPPPRRGGEALELGEKLAGRKINLLTVKGLRRKQGRYGLISTGVYEAVCRCGKEVTINYGQIYYKTIYSCGCTPRPKHPPIRLEGQTIGLVEVMRWAEEEIAWEVVCHECGALLYRRRTSEVREAGKSCETHGQVHLDPSK